MLGVMREEPGGDSAALGPNPGLAQLPALAERLRGAGVMVDLRVETAGNGVPPAIDLSAYRIIQEALTNTLKHAGPAQAGVTVRYGNGSVELEVVDDGQGPPPGRPRSGSKGLVGMRERVSLYGGRLDAGARPGGGFRVHAVLKSAGS